MAVIASDPMATHQYRVQKVKKETRDTYVLELEPTVSKDVISFLPGQFNMLYSFGVGEVPISISGDPATPQRLVHTVRMLGAITKSICNLKKGNTLGIRGPFGSHWPVDEAKGNDVIIVAGGIGLAPLRPAIYYILANRERYGSVILLYGARSPFELLFIKELEQWKGRFDMQVDVTVDSAPSGWRGNVALVTALIPKAPFDPYHTMAFVCGPEIMMRFTLLELFKRGLADKDIYVSMERNMKCGLGHCGHCQFGPYFICKDGPVFRYDKVKEFFEKREI